MSRSGSVNYKTNSGIQVGAELFNGTGAALFTVLGGSGSIEDDTTDSFGGNAASLILNGVAGTNATAKVTIASPVDTTGSDYITLAVKLESQDDFNRIRSGTPENVMLFYLNSGGAATGSVFYSLKSGLGEGWNLITISKSEFSAGTIDWSIVDWVQFAVQDKLTNDYAMSVKFGGIWSGIRQRPKLLIAFDDAQDSQYNAYTYMNGKNLPGCCFVLSTVIDEVDKLTLVQLNTMYASGWDILNHSSVHNVMVGNADWETELQAGKDWLNANGFTRGSNIMAPPGGSYDTVGTEIVKAMGYEWMRGVDAAYTNLSLGAAKRYNMPSIVLQDTVTLQDAKDYVNALIARGVTGCIYLHIIENPETSAGWDETAKFQPLIDYIKGLVDLGLLDVVSFSDLIKLKHERLAI